MTIRYMFYVSCFCAALLSTALLFSPTVLAQGVGTPTVTRIPGGLFFEWASPVEVAAVRFDKGLAGQFEIMFDVPSVGFLSDFTDRRQYPTANPDLVMVLADYWIVRGTPERAIPLYEESIRRGNLDDTRSLVFHNNLAMLYSQVLGRHADALNVVDSALATRRDNVTLLDTKGLILMNANRHAEAVPYLQRAVELSCQLPIYCMHLAYALYHDGRASQARRYFDPARDDLINALPRMSRENQAMFDTLQLALPRVD